MPKYETNRLKKLVKRRRRRGKQRRPCQRIMKQKMDPNPNPKPIGGALG